MFNMITDKGTKATYIYDKRTGKVHEFTGGRYGIEEALHFLSLKVFHEIMAGRPIGFKRDNSHPVKSLIPPVKKKLISFYDLGEEHI